MIVLDEQLLGRRIETALKAWYPGRVCYITELRPGTVIKDEAIPALLRQASAAHFVTINERDFWRRVPPDPRYCVICLALSDARAKLVPEMLRLLFARPELRRRADRLGKVIRVAGGSIHYYSDPSGVSQVLPLT